MSEQFYFERLLELAETAATRNEIPIAALVVKDSKIIGEAFNQTEARQSFLAHAELLAMQSASSFLKTKYLNECDLIVSVEPCQMCLAAAKLCRIRSVRYLLSSEKFGKSGHGYRDVECCKVSDPFFLDRQLDLLQSFFRKKR